MHDLKIMSEKTNIKPIETEYNGYRFRSRLEARWAVFFDEAGIAYEYEPEGFPLDNEEKYLPDFYLPEFDLFVEIKPSGVKEKMEAWEDKCRRFRTCTGKAILIKYGDPALDMWGRLYAWDYNDSGGGEFEDYAQFVYVGEYFHPEVIVMTFADRRESRICVSPDMRENKKVVCASMFIDYYWDDAVCTITGRMTEMFDENCADGTFNHMRKKARQARFEYGETPKHNFTPTIDQIKKIDQRVYNVFRDMYAKHMAGSYEEERILLLIFNVLCEELGWDKMRVYKILLDDIEKEGDQDG